MKKDHFMDAYDEMNNIIDQSEDIFTIEDKYKKRQEKILPIEVVDSNELDEENNKYSRILDMYEFEINLACEFLENNEKDRYQWKDELEKAAQEYLHLDENGNPK